MNNFYDLQKRNRTFLLALGVALLVIAKLAPIYHVQLPYPKTYLDVDRAVALALLVAVYFWKRPVAEVGKVLLLFVLAGVGAAAISCFIPVLSDQCVRVLILFFMTATVEEILFRGVVAELLLRKYGPVVAGLLSSLFFALVHPAAYVFPVYGVLVFLTGILCFVAYCAFRREHGYPAGILAASVAHIAVIMLGIWAGLL